MGLVCHNHWRKSFDITIRQTIKRYHILQQLELCLILQMEWCITHHIKAQYIETTLQCTEMKYSICSDAKLNEYQRQFLASPIVLVLVIKTIDCLILSSSVPAKPGIAIKGSY